jgi:hypothetical protein
MGDYEGHGDRDDDCGCRPTKRRRHHHGGPPPWWFLARLRGRRHRHGGR